MFYYFHIYLHICHKCLPLHTNVTRYGKETRDKKQYGRVPDFPGRKQGTGYRGVLLGREHLVYAEGNGNFVRLRQKCHYKTFGKHLYLGRATGRCSMCKICTYCRRRQDLQYQILQSRCDNFGGIPREFYPRNAIQAMGDQRFAQFRDKGLCSRQATPGKRPDF